MKLTISIILIFTSICCFAIDQKLIDGAARYNNAAANLDRIVSAKSEANLPLGEWIKESNRSTDKNLSDETRNLARNRLDEADKKYNNLRRQQIVYEEEIKKLAPIKAEYDKQKAKKGKIKDTIIDIINKLTMLSAFALFGWFIISRRKKYKQLLAERKITQEEYDRMTQCSEPSALSSRGTNPATGLPMVGIGISDAGGNIRGSSPGYDDYSSNSSSSAFSDYQTYQDRYH